MAKFALDDAEDERGEAKRRRSQASTSTSTSRPHTQPQVPVGEEIGVTIDSDLLDCSVCFHPLRPPLFQCTNGHVACPTCWPKLQNKCHICTLPVLSRNIALEKVLESVHLPCPYAHRGCTESVAYWQREMHTTTCEFRPSPCPIPDCTGKAFSGEWLGHLIRDHRLPHCNFSYGEYQTVIIVKQGDPYFIFSGPNEEVYLLVNEPVLNLGNALSLYSLDPPHPGQNVLSYELMVTTGTSTGTDSSLVQLMCQVGSVKEWKKGELRGCFLLVPSALSVSGQIEIRIVIKDCDAI